MSKFSFRKKGSNKSRKDFQKQEKQSRTETTAVVVEENRIPDDPDTPEESAARSKNFALKFSFLKDKLKVDANTEQNKSTVTFTQNN